MKKIIFFVIALMSCIHLSNAQEVNYELLVQQIKDSILHEQDGNKKLLIVNGKESLQLQKDYPLSQITLFKTMLDHYMDQGDEINSQLWLRRMENFGIFYTSSLNQWFTLFYKKGAYSYIEGYLLPKMDSICTILESKGKIDPTSHTDYSNNLSTFIEIKLALKDYHGAYRYLKSIYEYDQGFTNNYNSLQYATVLIKLGKEKEGIDLLAKLYIEEHNFNTSIEKSKNSILSEVQDGEQKFQNSINAYRELEQENYSFLLENTKDIYGKNLVDSLGKSKYILLSFWGTWCVPCIQSHPKLMELYNKYKDRGFEILSIASESGTDKKKLEDNLKKSIEKQNLSWLHSMLTQLTKRITDDYGVKAYPTKVLIDNKGNIIARFVGHEGDKIESVLEKLYAKKGI